MTDSPDDVRERLAALDAQHDDLNNRGHMRSALRVSQEMARLAREHGLVIPYLHARFKEMNRAHSVLEPELGCAVAVELVALLESEDRARQIEPALPEADYALTVGWLLSCAYDNLAEHTAQQQGYNSPGMQACISAGIEICRRTGKLECVNCFRTYAALVYRSADDLDMALHSARQVSGMAADAPGSYRRWSGAREEAWLLLLQGHLEAAAEVAHRSLELAAAYHNPGRARRGSVLLIRSIGLLAGTESSDPSGAPTRDVPAGEDADLDLTWDLHDALAATCRGDHEAAERLLIHWDQRLQKQRCLHEWFEVRLRLVALCRLVGNERRARSLAAPLEERAREACDWLTLRRLDRTLDLAVPLVPVPLLADLRAGPFGGQPRDESSRSPARGGSGNAGPPDPVRPNGDAVNESPLAAEMSEFAARLGEAGNDQEAVREVATEMLALVPPGVGHPFDAGWLLHLMQFALDSGLNLDVVWRWAREVAEPFPQDARVLNTLATLAAALSDCDNAPADLPTTEQIESLFRQSLDLDPGLPRNFARAGAFYLQHERLDDAERCLSRAFRLDRTSGPVVAQLAELYERSDRPRDGLAVLDLALREGCDEPQIAWQAAMLAYETSQFEALLTYLDRFESQRPGEGVTNYYRALAFLELNDPDRASAALEQEGRLNPQQPLPVAILKVCISGARDDLASLESQLEEMLEFRLIEASYLSFAGFSSLFHRLWGAVRKLDAQRPVWSRAVELMLESGLAPEQLFADLGPKGDPRDGVSLYRCLIWQPLDSRWARSRGCLPGQDEWAFYTSVWGVLAQDEEEARRLTLAWQGRCASLPAEIRDVEVADQNFTEVPRVVWQGMRINVDLNEADFAESETDEFDAFDGDGGDADGPDTD